jgi:hypothetical protein
MGTAYLDPALGLGLLFQILNVVTWALAFTWGFVIYATLTQRPWAYYVGLVTSGLTFLCGVIPAVIADTNAFRFYDTVSYATLDVDYVWVQEAFEFTMGSPHWAKTMSSLLVFVVMLLPWVYRSVKTYTSLENKIPMNVSRQLMKMSVFLFWLSAVSFLGTSFMAAGHELSAGITLMEVVELQTIGTYVTAIAGCTMLTGGFVLNIIKPTNKTTTTLLGA